MAPAALQVSRYPSVSADFCHLALSAERLGTRGRIFVGNEIWLGGFRLLALADRERQRCSPDSRNAVFLSPDGFRHDEVDDAGETHLFLSKTLCAASKTLHG